MVANGKLFRHYDEGKENLSEWESEAPLAVAGFNFGDFKREEAKNSFGILIESYANQELPDMFRSYSAFPDRAARTAFGIPAPENRAVRLSEL